MIHDIKIIQENNIRRRQIYSLNQQQDRQEFPPFRSSPHVSDSELPVRFADTYIYLVTKTSYIFFSIHHFQIKQEASMENMVNEITNTQENNLRLRQIHSPIPQQVSCFVN